MQRRSPVVGALCLVRPPPILFVRGGGEFLGGFGADNSSWKGAGMGGAGVVGGPSGKPWREEGRSRGQGPGARGQGPGACPPPPPPSGFGDFLGLESGRRDR